MDIKCSETLKNLMRAFSGETQARARYEYAAAQAQSQGFPVLAQLFSYTAGQEKEHAELLWKQLLTAGAAEIPAPGDYPVDLKSDMTGLLQEAAEHERKEAREVYPSFADTARQEGFPALEKLFRSLAGIEGVHGERFSCYENKLADGSLFQDAPGTKWICLNCGNVYSGSEPPAACSVCSHGQGYFIRLEHSPFQ